MVLECLGTKSVLARQFQEAGGSDSFDRVAYDAVAAIVNDLCCVGALPLVVNAYFATGSAEWYGDGSRLESLVSGWKRACEEAGATWGGGESPTLPGLISAGDIELAGSAVGYVPEGHEPVLGEDLADGDSIVLIASSGLHANGASLGRGVAAKAPEGLLTKLSGGRTLGDALLDPALIYVPLVRALIKQGTNVSYMSHITGHGFRKLMRARQDFTYRITSVPAVPEVLSYLVDATGMDAKDAYGTFNMGAGFAVYCRSDSAESVVAAATEVGLEAMVAGAVEEGPRRVIIEPVDVTYETADLSLR
jgi:phosphoribosylformylglycinamidine cyclo-ligase